MNKLTIEDWESSLMDRVSNNVTQDFGHELEKIVRNIFIPNWSQTMKEALIDEDQIHEVLAMIKESHYIYEKRIKSLAITERDLMSEIKEHKQNIKALCDRLDELENVQG